MLITSYQTGTPKEYDVTGDSGKINKHFFCGDCGSSLLTKLEVLPGKLVVKAGGLDNGGRDLKNVGVELYVKDRVSYLKGVEGAQQDQAWAATSGSS